MERIIERYERYYYAEQQLVASDSQLQGSWSLEYPRLKSRIEVLERNIRNYTGEDLDSLGLRELQNLEQQIDSALKRIRTRKNQLMHESISELQKKARALQEQNNMLAKKAQLKEKEKTANVNVNGHAQAEQQHQLGQNSSSLTQTSPIVTFPSLTIGSSSQVREAVIEERETQTRPNINALVPPWMLRHVNK